MDVPLWAFLVTSLTGPILGAGLAAFGVWINNRHAAQENEKNRALERSAHFRNWRTEQRSAAYLRTATLLPKLYDTTSESAQISADQIHSFVHEGNEILSQLRLHGAPRVLELLRDFLIQWRAFTETYNVNGPHATSASETEERLLVRAKGYQVSEAMRQHLDQLEGVEVTKEMIG